MSETDIELIMESIAECLFSVFVTLGVRLLYTNTIVLIIFIFTRLFSLIPCEIGSVPIIRSPRGNAAELVAERLDRKLRDNLKDQRGCLFTGADISSGITFGGYEYNNIRVYVSPFLGIFVFLFIASEDRFAARTSCTGSVLC